MNPSPSVALVINTYNQPDYLSRVLEKVSTQTSLPEEVLLADDGSEDQTEQVFSNWAQRYPRRSEHVWQKNQGFRRSRILNQAVARARGDYLVFLDGDTLPHPRFVADHRALATHDCFVQGHRALIQKAAAAEFGKGELGKDCFGATTSGQVRGLTNAFRWPVPFKRLRTDVRGIRGCNLGIWRSDLVRVNGYNETFTGWGREDAELAARLINCGVRRLDVRGWALCYHLWHAPASRAGLVANDQLLAAALNQRSQRCELGLDQHLPAATT